MSTYKEVCDIHAMHFERNHGQIQYVLADCFWQENTLVRPRRVLR